MWWQHRGASAGVRDCDDVPVEEAVDQILPMRLRPASPPEDILGDALLHVVQSLEGQATGLNGGHATTDLCFRRLLSIGGGQSLHRIGELPRAACRPDETTGPSEPRP